MAPEEIRASIEQAVRASYGVAQDDIANCVCQVLEFLRVTDEIRAAIDKERDALINAGRLRLKGDNVVLS